MEGLADVHLRRLLTAQGGYDWVVSEFLRVVDRAYPGRVFYKICPELQRGGKTACGTPVRMQLLGSDENAMAENAKRASQTITSSVPVCSGVLVLSLNATCTLIFCFYFSNHKNPLKKC